MFGLFNRKRDNKGQKPERSAWRDHDGTINWSRGLAGLGGLFAFGPAGAQAAMNLNNRIEDSSFNSRQPGSMYGSGLSNLGLGSGPNMSQYMGQTNQPSSGPTNQQLMDPMAQWANQMQLQRIDAAAGGAPIRSSNQTASPGLMMPRHENTLGYSNLIRNMGGSNAFEGIDTWTANHDVKELTRKMVR